MTSSNDFIAEIFTRMSQKSALCMISFKESCQEHFDWLENFHKEVLQSEDDCDRPLLPKTPVPKSKKRPAAVSSSEDEANHISKQITDSEISLNSTGKPRRNASKMASAKINVQTQMKLNSKLRRPTASDKENVQKDISITKNIKVEKDIILPTEQTPALNDATNDMPPPMFKPKRGRKKIKSEAPESAESETETVRTTRSKRTVKKEKDDQAAVEIKVPVEAVCPDKPKRSTRTRRRPDSDVVIQEVPVTVITISDNDDDFANKPIETAGALSEAESNIEEPITDNKVTDTEDEEPTKKGKGKKKTKKATKTAGKKENVNEDKPLNGIVEKPVDSVAEKERMNEKDKPEETEKPKRKSSQDNEKIVSNMNCTVTLQKDINETYTAALNSTQVIQKELTSLLAAKENTPLNTTHVIEKAKHSPQIQQIMKESGINFNCTVVLDKMNATVTLNDDKKTDSQVVNKTMILSPKESNTGHWQKNDIVLPPALDNLLTDDDDSIVVSNKKQTPVKKADTKKAAKTKPMFSPYANSPVKKRVAAFEQLGTGATDMPTRVTRTKTKMLTEKENELKGVAEESTASRVRSKYITPVMSKKIPSMIPHTDGKQYRTQTFTANKMYNTSTLSSDVSVKSATAVKPTKAELIERKAEEQRRRLEKEEDVKRKKEALLQAKIEEQKRRREEKQAKAQKAREQIDREKEEKFRQMLQEKEEKQLEEQQRKREWAVKKAAEMEERRKIEEQIKLAKMREYEMKKKQAEELRKAKYGTKPPPLPTEDGDDSDSSTENVKPRVPGPFWGQKKQLTPHLLMMRHIPRQFIETFFQMQPTTPDLRDIFESVDERTLRRNSSAVWRTPPRYSTLPKF